MVITVCIAVLAFCTLVALATAVIARFTGRYTYRDNSGWFLVTIVGMIMLTITIGILCNTTTNWK